MEGRRYKAMALKGVVVGTACGQRTRKEQNDLVEGGEGNRPWHCKMWVWGTLVGIGN